MRLARITFIPVWSAFAVTLAFGLYMVMNVPDDYQQGASVRIMFVHVPSAWMSLLAYSFLALMSAFGLIFRHPLAHFAARAAAPVGAVLTLAALVSGALWGKPIWGTWWVWDARLTSMLVLLFIYLGYLAIWQVVANSTRAAQLAAIFALVGFVNVPIVKFSVDWWHTLHQPASLSSLKGVALHSDFLYPLLVMAVAFHLLFIALVLTRMQTEILWQRWRVRQNLDGEVL